MRVIYLLLTYFNFIYSIVGERKYVQSLANIVKFNHIHDIRHIIPPLVEISKLIFLSRTVSSVSASTSPELLDDQLTLKKRIDSCDYTLFRPGKLNSDIFYPTW